MASGGIDKYKKYFQGKDVDTTVKGDAFLLDINTGKKIVSLKSGTKIKVLRKKTWEQYNKKYLIEVVVSSKKYLGLLPDASVAKPITKNSSSADLRLKPQYLGLEEKESGYPLKDVIKNVITSIKNRDDLTTPIKNYLIYLIEQCGKVTTKTIKLEKIDFSKISDGEMNQIKKDFGEIIGAISVVADNKLFKTLKIDSKAHIFYPTRGNEPLMDFKIIAKSGIKLFSAKSGTTTNTLKPADLLTLINADPKLKAKWKNTLEYKFIEVLNEHSILRGPLVLCDLLNTEYTKYKYKKSMKGLLEDEKESTKRSSSAFISEVYQAEKHIVDLSKNMKFTEMFFDAIVGKIYYINLSSFDSNMLPVWKTEGESSTQKHDKTKTVSFRSKNSNNRMKDKLGLQM